jgi:hypothetical protein
MIEQPFFLDRPQMLVPCFQIINAVQPIQVEGLVRGSLSGFNVNFAELYALFEAMVKSESMIDEPIGRDDLFAYLTAYAHDYPFEFMCTDTVIRIKFFMPVIECYHELVVMLSLFYPRDDPPKYRVPLPKSMDPKDPRYWKPQRPVDAHGNEVSNFQQTYDASEPPGLMWTVNVFIPMARVLIVYPILIRRHIIDALNKIIEVYYNKDAMLVALAENGWMLLQQIVSDLKTEPSLEESILRHIHMCMLVAITLNETSIFKLFFDFGLDQDVTRIFKKQTVNSREIQDIGMILQILAAGPDDWTVTNFIRDEEYAKMFFEYDMNNLFRGLMCKMLSRTPHQKTDEMYAQRLLYVLFRETVPYNKKLKFEEGFLTTLQDLIKKSFFYDFNDGIEVMYTLTNLAKTDEVLDQMMRQADLESVYQYMDDNAEEKADERRMEMVSEILSSAS